MSDTITPQATTETVAQPSPQPELTPQAQSRQDLYNKYYSQTQPTESSEPVGVEVVDGAVQDPTAQVEPTPTPTPVVEPTPVNPTEELVRTLQAQVEALQAKLAPPPTQQPPQPEVPISKRFLEKLREDPEAAVDDLYNSIRMKVEEDLRTKLGPEVQQKAVAQVALEREIDGFVNTLRAENPDLIPMEELISVKAGQYLDAAKNSGNIKSDADFIREYKAACQKAVVDTKKIYQQVRGAGAAQAMQTRQQVVQAQPLPPNATQVSQPNNTPQAPSNDPMDYIAKRQMANMARRGITPQQ
jgi:hypothetical protein